MKAVTKYACNFGSALALMMGAGCSNHIRDIEATTNETQRDVTLSQFQIELSEDPPNDSVFVATAKKNEIYKVKNFQTHTVSELCTPYQGWRKSYEVPAGLGMLPVSLLAHIGFVFTFGMLPYSVPQAANSLAFDGMNPFMNFESESRAETVPVSVKRKMIDEYSESKTLPLANAKITVKSGDRSWFFTSDNIGKFEVCLVAPDINKSVFADSREIQFFVPGNAAPVKETAISRTLAGRLIKARALIADYNSAPSGKTLAKTIAALEKLNFNKLSFAMEKEELAKHKTDPAFARDFNDAVSEQAE